MRRLGAFLVSCFACVLSLQAQLPTATLTGTVTDPKGAVVVGADLTLISPATSVERRTTSGSDGSYSFFNLLPGRYELTAQAAGFSKQDLKDVVLEVGRISTINIPMTLARVGETVTVTAGEAQVQLAQSEVQGMIPSETITNIPLNGRNFLELAFLLPGNRPATNFDPTKTNTLEVSSAGQFGRGGNITVDGGDNNDEVVGGTLMNFPQDSIGEFQIATNRYTAEVGRSGSSIINIVTKSGGNDLHGGLFGFFRNRNIQARPATLAATQDKPRFDRQQFGGSLGGALARDKAWWFISGEDRNQHAAIPTAFRNFTTRTIVPSSAGTPLDDVLLLARQDVKLNDHDSLFIRYGFNRSLETAQGSLRKPIGTAAQRQSSLNRFNSILGNWTRVFGTNKANNLAFHVNTFLNEIPSFANNHPVFNTPALTLTNEIRFPSLQDGANFRIPQRTRLQRYQARDTFTLTRGPHALNFGAEWQKMYSDAVFDLFGSGTIFTTEDFATTDRNGDGVVNDLDIPVSVAIRSTGPVHPPFVPDIDNTYLGWFAQDDWKARSNLTFNLGIRYELDTDLLGVGPNHDPCPLPLTTTPAKPCVWVRDAVPENRSRDPKDFSPRIGFAWDPFKKGTTVVRGGYGMYFDRVVLEVRLLELLLDGRALSLAALGGSTLDANGRFIPDPVTKQTVSLANPFGGPPSPLAIGINELDHNMRHPRVQQFTFGLQQQIGNQWILSADAIHNFGTSFLLGRLLRDSKNQAVNVTDPLTKITNQVVLIGPYAKTWYDGLVLSLQQRPAHLTGDWTYAFNANYTLSKSLNFANDDQIPFNTDQQVDANFGVNNLRLEKGYSPTDERHRFTFYGTLSAPFDISISPILTLSSSVPIDGFVPDINSRLPLLARNGLARQAHNSAQLNSLIDRWNALTPCPAAGGVFPCHQGPTLPHVASGLTFGDKFVSADLRVTKGIKLTERQKLNLIGEVFNLSNTTNIRGTNNANYSGRQNAINAPNFYQALQVAGGFFGAGGPRAFQFALRWSF